MSTPRSGDASAREHERPGALEPSRTNSGGQGGRVSERHGPLAAAAGLGALSLVAVWGAFSIPAGPGFATVGPSAFPVALSIGLAALAALAIVQAARGRMPDEMDNPEEPALPGARARMGWMLAGMVLTPLALHLTGFLLGGTLGFATVARAFGARNWGAILGLGLAATLVAWLVFDRLLTLNLGGALVRLPAF